MIYVTHYRFLGSKFIRNIWNSHCENIDDLYKSFILKESKKRNVIINPHWLNMMNHCDHHTYLSKSEYKKKYKEWNKFLKLWDFDKFIEEKCGGKKIKYNEI